MNMPISGQGVSNSTVQWLDTVDNGSQKGGGGLWQKFTELFSPRTTTVNQFINTQETFKGYFSEQVSLLSESIPESQREVFLGRAQEAMNSIVESCLGKARDEAIGRGDGTITEKTLNEVIKSANEKAQQALENLTLMSRTMKDQGGDIRPQLLPRSGGGFNLVHQAPQIENLVLRGGGGKGLAYPPALRELEQAGMLAGVKHMVGSSAGALTATLLSSGMTTGKFQEFSEKTNVMSLMWQPLDKTQYPMVDTGLVGMKAGGAIEVLDQTSATQVSDYLKEHWNTLEFQTRLATMDEDSITRLGLLRDQKFGEGVDRSSQMITFGDLHLLHQIDPGTFKELTLTGFNNQDKSLQYFNFENTPGMPIAIAGRISMSLPIVCAPVIYDIGDGRGPQPWVDGGVGSNMPTGAIFDDLEGRDLEEARARTLLMTFDEDGKGYEALHGTEESRHTGAGGLDKFSGNPNIDQVRNQDRDNMYDSGVNTLVVLHSGLETLSFNPGKETLEHAKGLSSTRTLEFIEQHQNQRYMTEVSSLEDAISLMSDLEKEVIREGGRPDPRNYPDGEQDQQFRIDNDLYGLLTQEGIPQDIV
ncbi:patatin-like phospholipase family protein [Pseudothauera rhizosphaerae]|nr:patatin-like phospholipase family protein [Pseudothauera rhizosphaerae]